MRTDLPTQLAEYGRQLRSDLPQVSSDEVMFRSESSMVVGGRSDRPGMRRRRGVLVVAGAFLVVLLAGLLQIFASNTPEVAETVSPQSDLGVFEPIRGWIVYPTGGGLEAVNPENPSERAKLDLPGEAAWSAPLGWSADGSMLLLQNENAGNWHVLDSSGETPLHGPTAGCCLFVGTNTISPDGGYRIRGFAGGIGIDSLASGPSRPIVDIDQFEDLIGWRDATWSPDGDEIAFVGERKDGMTVMVVSLDSGAIRELDDSTLGYVRHLAWSPDGSQLLVTSADLYAGERENDPPMNPLVNPVAARLYVVDINGSERREIASGHYIATAWSPDGTRIAALDYSSRGRRVVLMDANGSRQEELPDVVPSGPFTGIAWHPSP